MTVRPAKTQISLGIRPDWSESSLCSQWVAKDPSFLHADNEDSDQTGRRPRLIWVFAGCTCHFVGFVMRRLSVVICGSIMNAHSLQKLSMKLWTIQTVHGFARNVNSSTFLIPSLVNRWTLKLKIGLFLKQKRRKIGLHLVVQIKAALLVGWNSLAWISIA